MDYCSDQVQETPLHEYKGKKEEDSNENIENLPTESNTQVNQESHIPHANTLWKNHFLRAPSIIDPCNTKTFSLNRDNIEALIKKKTIKKFKILQKKLKYETSKKELNDAIMEFEEICLHLLIRDCKKRKDQRNFKDNIYFNQKDLTHDTFKKFFNNPTLITEKKVFVELYIFELCKDLSQFKSLIINKSEQWMGTFRKIENIYYYELLEKLRNFASLLIKKKS